MTFWVTNMILGFALCVFLAGIIIPQILLIAFRRKLFDVPDERKIHTSAVPRLGGIAFEPVIVFTMAFIMGMDYLSGHGEMLSAASGEVMPLAMGFCSLIMLYLVGIADDLVGIRYMAKFIVQILCGVFMIAGGIWLENLHGVFGIYELAPYVGYPLTVLVVVFVINAINLIDGIDGLASGLSSVAMLIYGVSFFATEHYVYSFLAFSALGVLVPFFYYNVFGNADKHKKIFMGDTGSLTIGLLISILSIHLAQTYPTGTFGMGLNPVVIAFSPLVIPCFDVLRVYLHRLRAGRNPFLPDKCHIHHKLLALGVKQRWAMITIIMVSFAYISLNVALSPFLNATILVLIDVCLWIVANMILTRKIKQRQERLNLSVPLFQ